MKSFFMFILLSIVVILLWASSGSWEYNRENYISNKVLELAVPFDVKIDVEFLKSLQQ